MEFARATANRLPMQQVFFRSRDNGKTWKEVCRLKGPYLIMTTSHDFTEAPDGSLLLLTAAVPFPEGDPWGPRGGRFVTILMQSKDHAETWKVISVIGTNDFNEFEYLGYSQFVGYFIQPVFRLNEHLSVRFLYDKRYAGITGGRAPIESRTTWYTEIRWE